MTDPRLTVIVPIYNRSREVERLIGNLSAQDMPDAEFLLIDDGSTDDTVACIKRLLPGDDRFRFITKPNTGTGDTRNLGIHEARGSWVFFLDSDDAIPSAGTLSRLVSLAESEHVEVAGGDTQFEKRGKTLPAVDGWSDNEPSIMEAWVPVVGDLPREPFEYFGSEGVFNYRDYQYDAGFSRFVYSRDLLVDNGIEFPRATFFEDPLFFVRAMDAASQFAVIAEPTYVYRIGSHPGRYDFQFCKEHLQGFRSNLLFSKEQGYCRLHRITYERFKRFDAVELALNEDTYGELSQLVRDAYEAFDPAFADGEDSAGVPLSVEAVNCFGTPEWSSRQARMRRVKKLSSIKIKNTIKQSAIFRAFDD